MKYTINRYWKDADHEHIDVTFDGDSVSYTVSIAHIDFEHDGEKAHIRQLITLARRIREDQAAIVVIRG